MEVYFDQQPIYPSMITSLYPNPFLMYPFIPFRHQQTDTKLILDEEIISDWLFEVLMSNLAIERKKEIERKTIVTIFLKIVI